MGSGYVWYFRCLIEISKTLDVFHNLIVLLKNSICVTGLHNIVENSEGKI